MTASEFIRELKQSKCDIQLDGGAVLSGTPRVVVTKLGYIQYDKRLNVTSDKHDDGVHYEIRNNRWSVDGALGEDGTDTLEVFFDVEFSKEHLAFSPELAKLRSDLLNAAKAAGFTLGKTPMGARYGLPNAKIQCGNRSYDEIMADVKAALQKLYDVFEPLVLAMTK